MSSKSVEFLASRLFLLALLVTKINELIEPLIEKESTLVATGADPIVFKFISEEEFDLLVFVSLQAPLNLNYFHVLHINSKLIQVLFLK